MFFETIYTIRIRTETLRKIRKLVAARMDKFDSKSHFIRCAIEKAVREEEIELRELIVKQKKQNKKVKQNENSNM